MFYQPHLLNHGLPHKQSYLVSRLGYFEYGLIGTTFRDNAQNGRSKRLSIKRRDGFIITVRWFFQLTTGIDTIDFGGASDAWHKLKFEKTGIPNKVSSMRAQRISCGGFYPFI